MKLFPGQSPGSLSWRLAVPAAVALVLLAVGVAFAAYFASQAIDGTTVAQETDEPTATAPAAGSSPAAAATAEPSPETTPQATRGALGCVDCPVKAGDQLRVTAEDIQLGKDGRYYVPDRGDGCSYRQVEWGPGAGAGWVTLHDPACEMFWVYRPVIGEVQAWTP